MFSDSTKPKKQKRKSASFVAVEEVLDPSVGISDSVEQYKHLICDIQELEKKNQTLENEKSVLEKELKQKSKSRPKQELDRQRKSTELWKQKYFEVRRQLNRKIYARNSQETEELKETVNKLRSSLSSQRHYYKNKVEELEEKELAALRDEDQMEKEYKSKVAFLENEISQLEFQNHNIMRENSEKIVTKESKTYSSELRECIYYALAHQCPVEKAAKIVAFTIEKITGKSLQSVPHPTTVGRMAREMGVLADVQAGESLYQKDNCTLAWDATELAGSHINEVHIAAPAENSTSSREYLTLGVAQLPGGTASDYTSHIQQCVQDISDTLAEYQDKDRTKVHEKMQQHITSSISDRVAVNHAVVKELQKAQAVNADFLELNCNVHPLDTLSSTSRSVLKATNIKGATYGNDCAAANFIHGLSKLRYKQGKGDPVRFKAFMKAKHIPLKMFPRYVGNRMHILFHLTGITFYLKDDLLEFLTKYSAARGGLSAALAKDIQNTDILDHLQVLGLFGKYVTGPWMTMFYTESSSNLDMSPYLRNCVASLQQLVENPSFLITATHDVFGSELHPNNDPVLKSLRAGTPKPKGDLIKAIATAMLEVCKRQLKKYLDTEFTEEEKTMARYAPVHNMHAERIMAMADAQARRAPSAKMDFVQAKIKFQSNDTISFLQNKSQEERQNLIKFSVHKSRQLSNISKKREDDVQQEIMKRMMQKSRKRDEAERRTVERHVRSLESLHTNITSENIKELSKDEEFSAELQTTILELFVNPKSFVNKQFHHTWCDRDTNTDTVYFGNVAKLRKRKVCTFVVSYRELQEDQEDEVDYDITRTQIVTDLIYGDIVLH